MFYARDFRSRRRGTISGGSDGITVTDDWHYFGDSGEPAMENSFINLSDIGAGYNRGGFRKIGDYLQIVGGFIGAANTTMFTLPVTHRPSVKLAFNFGVCVEVGGPTANTFDGIFINTDGTVVSGSNPQGYTTPLWSIPNGILFPLDPGELST